MVLDTSAPRTSALSRAPQPPPPRPTPAPDPPPPPPNNPHLYSTRSLSLPSREAPLPPNARSPLPKASLSPPAKRSEPTHTLNFALASILSHTRPQNTSPHRPAASRPPPSPPPPPITSRTKSVHLVRVLIVLLDTPPTSSPTCALETAKPETHHPRLPTINFTNHGPPTLQPNRSPTPRPSAGHCPRPETAPSQAAPS